MFAHPFPVCGKSRHGGGSMPSESESESESETSHLRSAIQAEGLSRSIGRIDRAKLRLKVASRLNLGLTSVSSFISNHPTMVFPLKSSS